MMHLMLAVNVLLPWRTVALVSTGCVLAVCHCSAWRSGRGAVPYREPARSASFKGEQPGFGLQQLQT